MTVSGEEKGLWGSHYFSEHPTVPLPQLVADLNIDMVGRNWKDTIVAIGKEHSDLGATLNRVGEQHKELHVAPIDDRWPGGEFLLPLRPLQLCAQGRAHPVLLQRHPRRLSSGERFAGQDRRGEAVTYRETAVLPRAGYRQRAQSTEVESGELYQDRTTEAGDVGRRTGGPDKSEVGRTVGR